MKRWENRPFSRIIEDYLSPKGLHKAGSEHNSISAPSIKDLSHILPINDFIVYLQIAAEDHGFKASYVKGDPFLRRENRFENYLRRSGMSFINPMYPDIVFCMENQQKRKALYLVEIERSTIPIASRHGTSIKEKIFTMAMYLDSHIFQFFNDVFQYDFAGFRYLIVTTGNRTRVNKIISACHNQQEDFDFVWMTPMSAISEKTIFNCIWKKLNSKDNNLYSIINNSISKQGE